MDLPVDERTQAGAILVALVAYVALLSYAVLTGDPTATLAADVLFGLAMLAVGGYLLWALETTPLSSATAALLVSAGIAALGAVVTGDPTLGTTSDLLFLAGVVCYVLLRRRGQTRPR